MIKQAIHAGLCLVAVLAVAGLAAGCGDDETTTTSTVTDTSAITTAPATSTTTGTTSTTTGTTSTTTTSTTSTGPTTTPANQTCTNGQVYSQSSGSCVDPNPSGNPCPEGEVPMADEPVCVPKD